MKPCRWFTPFATIHICDLSTAPSFPVSGILNMLDLVDFHGKSTIPKTCRNVSKRDIANLIIQKNVSKRVERSPKMSYLELGDYDSTRTDGVHSRHCYLNLPILCGAMPAPDLPQKRKLDGSASSSADPFEHQVHGDLPSKVRSLLFFQCQSNSSVHSQQKFVYMVYCWVRTARLWQEGQGRAHCQQKL